MQIHIFIEPTTKNKQPRKKPRYLIHTWSDIALRVSLLVDARGNAIFAFRVTWHYAYSPFNTLHIQSL